MRKIIITWLSCTISIILVAQNNYIVNAKMSEIVVTGTSTLHDWEMKTNEVQGKMSGTFTSTAKNISDVQIQCNTSSIKSKDEKVMDEKAHESLKAKAHPTIKFAYVSIGEITTNGNNFNGTITGIMTIAGKSVKVSLPYSGTLSSNGDININSHFSITMSTFGISPPSLMLGSIKVGDKITIKTKLLLTKQ